MSQSIDPSVAAPVWWAIALHLDVQPEEVLCEQELRTDLHLDGLDLALIVMRVGDWLRVDLPPSITDDAMTVGDLARAIVTLLSELDEDQRPSVVSIRPQSGTHRISADGRATRVECRRR
jgi:acyl carrier protein